MAILTLTSAGGSPGVTTLAVGLALTWPRPVILADCDPGAHQAVLAGYFGGRVAPSGKGLLRIAEAHRDRRPLREVLLDQTLPLTDDDAVRRLLLPGFTRPSSAAHFGGVWPDLAEAFDRLSEVELDVIVDAGRIGPAGIPSPLAERSAATAIVMRSTLRSVVSVRTHLPTLRDQALPNLDGRQSLGLVVVGEGRPYSRAEIAKALDLPVLGVIAEDRPAAAHLSDGAPRARRFDGSALIRSVVGLATTLADGLQRSAELVRS